MHKRLINIMDLHRTINEKNEKKIECYEKILEICHKKITIASENKKLKHIFDIPEYIVGYPLFNLNNCITFIIDNLRINGFLVKYFFPKTLYVSWDFEEIKTEANENKQLEYKQTQNNKLLEYNNIKENRYIKQGELEQSEKNLFNIKKISKQFLTGTGTVTGTGTGIKTNNIEDHNKPLLNLKKSTGRLELNLF